jgi:hypothetical protein
MLVAFVAALLTAALHPRSGEVAAHLWGRYLADGREDGCPTNFGHAFWFACAGQVRAVAGDASARHVGAR